MKRMYPAFMASRPGPSWFALLLLLVGACKGTSKESNMPKPKVNVVTVGTASVPFSNEYAGEVLGSSDVEIQSRIDGWITGIHFKEGQRVAKGQLLYSIDDQPIREKIVAAQGKVAQANTYLVRAQKDLDRVRPLAEMNALSKRELDAAIADRDAAQAEVNIAKSSLRQVSIELSYTKIYAPIAGVIGLSKFQIGDYVGRSSGIAFSSMNTISNLDRVRVRFPITEKEFLEYRKKVTDSSRGKVKAPMTLILSDGTVYDEAGSLDLADRQVDPATGSITLQATYANSEGLLRPGQYVKVRLINDLITDAVLVPQQAVMQMQNLYRVFVLNDSNVVRPRMVQAGKRIGTSWVINSGLKAGEKVVIVGNAIVRPGAEVVPVPMKWNYDSSIMIR